MKVLILQVWLDSNNKSDNTFILHFTKAIPFDSQNSLAADEQLLLQVKGRDFFFEKRKQCIPWSSSSSNRLLHEFSD
jgi:hypothetical protein